MTGSPSSRFTASRTDWSGRLALAAGHAADASTISSSWASASAAASPPPGQSNGVAAAEKSPAYVSHVVAAVEQLTAQRIEIDRITNEKLVAEQNAATLRKDYYELYAEHLRVKTRLQVVEKEHAVCTDPVNGAQAAQQRIAILEAAVRQLAERAEAADQARVESDARAADAERRARTAESHADETKRIAADAQAAAAAAAALVAESERQISGLREQLCVLPPGQTVGHVMTQLEGAEKKLENVSKEYEQKLHQLQEQLMSAVGAAAAAAGNVLAPDPGPHAITHEPGEVTSVEEMIAALRKQGLKSSQLCIFIDCTKSNLTNGAKSFFGRSLHDVSDPNMPNPYQVVIQAIGQTLAPFDSDGLIPVYGFGDRHSADVAVFPFHGKPDDPKALCQGLEEVLAAYTSKIGSVTLAGPTSFAPAIKKTIEHVKANKEREFTFCLIIADGQVNNVKDTEAAIVEASKLPISICCVGVGDGPWGEMYRFDDNLPARKFDNFQFVELNAIAADAMQRNTPIDVAFARAALHEVPEQFAQARALKMLPSN